MNSQTITNDDDPVLTIRDIAHRTQLSAGYIYKKTISGEIEHYSFGGTSRKRGAIRFSERQYRQFLSNQLDQCQPVSGLPVNNIQAATLTQRSSTVTQTLNQLLNTKQKKKRA